MKNKGFTLIELLAVIVILAIIALIATPIVLGIVENSKKNAMIRGAEYYINALELGIVGAKLDNLTVSDGEYTINSSGDICKNGECIEVEVQGKIPHSGSIVITNGKISNVLLNYDNKTIMKDNNGSLVFSEKFGGGVRPVPFATDSWETIITNIRNGNVSAYTPGDEREITLTSKDDNDGNADGIINGQYTVRIANKTTNDDEGVCTDITETKSQTACGFVIEFVDVIAKKIMKAGNPNDDTNNGTNHGGWEHSELREYVNSTIFAALPEELKKIIIETNVVSGCEYGKSTNYVTKDKLYLLSTKEIHGEARLNDLVNDETRQLDYYYNEKISPVSHYGTIKYYNGSRIGWWLRSATNEVVNTFYGVETNGTTSYLISNYSYGVAPAFRIG